MCKLIIRIIMAHLAIIKIVIAFVFVVYGTYRNGIVDIFMQELRSVEFQPIACDQTPMYDRIWKRVVIRYRRSSGK